jgi:hypothetical protein
MNRSDLLLLSTLMHLNHLKRGCVPRAVIEAPESNRKCINCKKPNWHNNAFCSAECCREFKNKPQKLDVALPLDAVDAMAEATRLIAAPMSATECDNNATECDRMRQSKQALQDLADQAQELRMGYESADEATESRKEE